MHHSRTRFYDLIRPDFNQAQGFIGCAAITLFPLALLFGLAGISLLFKGKGTEACIDLMFSSFFIIVTGGFMHEQALAQFLVGPCPSCSRDLQVRRGPRQFSCPFCGVQGAIDYGSNDFVVQASAPLPPPESFARLLPAEPGRTQRDWDPLLSRDFSRQPPWRGRG